MQQLVVVGGEQIATIHLVEGFALLLLVLLWAGLAYRFQSESAAAEGGGGEELAKDGDAGAAEAEAQREQRQAFAKTASSSFSTSEGAAGDIQELLRTTTRYVAQRFGPAVAKGQAVRSILATRMETFPGKAKSFLMNELNNAAGELLRAVEAEEAMMLLEIDREVESNFPAVSILLAGLASPTMLSLASAVHAAQLVVVILPIFVLSAWSLRQDWGAVCSIPSMTLWGKANFVMALLLGVGNAVVAVLIRRGNTSLAAKTERAQAKLRALRERSASSMGTNELRELFVCGAVLVQEALLVEDRVKESFWFHFVGVGTAMWLPMTLWTFVLVFGWTIVPGQVAFDESAAIGDHYCAAWATVLTARVSCYLAAFTLLVNLLIVANWACSVLVKTQSFANAVLTGARGVDSSGVGFPLAEVLVKAFLLRGTADTMQAQLSVAIADQTALEQEREELLAKLAALDTGIHARVTDVAALKERVSKLKAKGVADPLGVGAGIGQLDGADINRFLEEWRQRGRRATHDAEAQAAALQGATTQELEKLLEKVMACAEQIQQSDTLMQVQQAAHAGVASASEATAVALDQAQKSEVLAQAKQTAQASFAAASQATAGLLQQARQSEACSSQAQQAAEVGVVSVSSAAAAALAQAQQSGAMIAVTGQANNVPVSEQVSADAHRLMGER